MRVKAKVLLFYTSRQRAGVIFELDDPAHFCKVTMEEVPDPEDGTWDPPLSPKSHHKPTKQITPGKSTGDKNVI